MPLTEEQIMSMGLAIAIVNHEKKCTHCGESGARGVCNCNSRTAPKGLVQL